MRTAIDDLVVHWRAIEAALGPSARRHIEESFRLLGLAAAPGPFAGGGSTEDSDPAPRTAGG